MGRGLSDLQRRIVDALVSAMTSDLEGFLAYGQIGRAGRRAQVEIQRAVFGSEGARAGGDRVTTYRALQRLTARGLVEASIFDDDDDEFFLFRRTSTGDIPSRAVQVYSAPFNSIDRDLMTRVRARLQTLQAQ